MTMRNYVTQPIDIDGVIQQARLALDHLVSRDAYRTAYERYYRGVKRRFRLKLLEREIRALIGRKTERMVARCARHPASQLLEKGSARTGGALDVGCAAKGRMALTLGARHPGIRVDRIEISPTNVRIARRLNRLLNVTYEGSFEAFSGTLRASVSRCYGPGKRPADPKLGQPEN